MNTPAKTGSPGMTLLEMTITLFIVMLFLGMAASTTRNVLGDEDIRTVARELQILAKTARKSALDTNRPQEISLQREIWTLHSANNHSLEHDSISPATETTTMDYHLPKNIQWKVKHWRSTQWENPGELKWIFSATGLCEPLRFRLERHGSWMEFSFHPLTANPQEVDFYLP